MPKPEPGSTKALSNAMKYRGLQKLKYYCEMCKKQCRDENAFKCHSQSESHQRQMRLFAENHSYYINEYSKEFERAFLDLMKRKYFQKKVSANKVYVEMISNKTHVHMNSTKWTTLTGFVEHLHQTGKCIVEQTEKGQLIQYIDKSPEAIANKIESEKRLKAEKKALKKENKAMEKYMENISQMQKKNLPVNSQPEDKSLNDDGNEIKIDEKKGINIEFSFGNKPNVNDINSSNPFEVFSNKKSNEFHLNLKTKPTNKIDNLLQEIKENKKKNHTEGTKKEFPWISKNLVVKIKDKDLELGKFYNKKGEIVDLDGEYIAIVEILETQDRVKVDQKLLETVIPKIGSYVRIVKPGESYGKSVILKDVDQKKQIVFVTSNESLSDSWYKYDEICKLKGDF